MAAAELVQRLGERIKELTLLHRAARLLNRRGEASEVVGAIAQLLPSGFCYPEHAEARIHYAGMAISSSAEAPGPWTLRADFETEGQERGFVQVSYRTLPAGVGDSPFLPEERGLIDSVAELLTAYFERVDADKTRARLALAEAAEQAALAANRARGDFLGVVAHELRSSLHVMLGWIQLLEGGQLDASATTRGIAILHRNATLQAKLIEDLLDLSRIDAGKLSLDLRPLDLRELLSFAVDGARPAAESKGLQLVSELEPVGNVIGDQQRLQQIIYNLLGNAVKFTPEGGRIEVKLVRRGGMAEVSVVDTGMGIERELLPHIFERFRQADSSRKVSRGLGLGLAIAHHLMQRHEGNMTAWSEGLGKGTRFTFTLPLQLPA